jgi:uroporphyrinogen-III synthase
MQGLRLIVTRPEEDATGLAEKLASLGHDGIAVPLIRIVATSLEDFPDLPWQALCATSANALRCRSYDDALKALPLLTVGPQSLAEARHRGFTRASAHGGDVQGLSQYITQHLKPDGGPILYLSGAETSADLAGKLRHHGFNVHRAIVYDAQPQVPEDFASHLESADGVLLYSPRTAMHWLAAVDAVEGRARASEVMHYCLSANVAAKLPHTFRRSIAARPDENGMLALLDATSD